MEGYNQYDESDEWQCPSCDLYSTIASGKRFTHYLCFSCGRLHSFTFYKNRIKDYRLNKVLEAFSKTFSFFFPVLEITICIAHSSSYFDAFHDLALSE